MARHSTTPATPRPPLFPRRRRRRGLLALAPAGAAPSRGGGGGGGAPPPPGSPGDIDVRIRSEVEAPFRTVRLVLFGFFAGSASVGAAIAATQVLGAFLRARNGDTGGIALADAATSLAVDLGAVGLFAFLFSRDWAAREKQIARLQREADLGALRLRLSTGARRRLASLRGFARPVIVFGTQAQVEAALAAAEPLREQLESRGVLIVPAPFLDGAGDDRAGSGGEASSSSSAPSSDNAKGDLRWKAQALDSAAWRAWFEQQAKLANNAKIRNGLYGERKKKSFFSSGQGWEFRALARKLERKNKNSPPPPLLLLLPPFKNHIFSVGLRIDGRVRASGSGSPPWAAFAAQLPPMEGVFKGEFVVVVFDTGLEVEVLMETSKKEEKGKLTSSIFFSSSTLQALATASTGACEIENKREREDEWDRKRKESIFFPSVFYCTPPVVSPPVVFCDTTRSVFHIPLVSQRPPFALERLERGGAVLFFLRWRRRRIGGSSTSGLFLLLLLRQESVAAAEDHRALRPRRARGRGAPSADGARSARASGSGGASGDGDRGRRRRRSGGGGGRRRRRCRRWLAVKAPPGSDKGHEGRLLLLFRP